MHRPRTKASDRAEFLRQAAGCVAQRAAIMGDTSLIGAAQEFAREWQRLLDDKGTTFRQVVEAKAVRQSVRLRPLEKRAQAGAEKGGAADV